MIRLFVSEKLSAQKNILLTQEQTHYLLHVMRLKEKDCLAVFNGQDGLWTASFQPEKKKAILCVLEQIQQQQNLPFLGLALACIKKENLELVIQKATELGVSDIFLLFTEHTVHRKVNLERLNAIAIEACEQSERLCLPTIHPPVSFLEFVAQKKDFNLYFLAERTDLKKTLKIQKPCFVIGPEGGFSEAEKKQFPAENTISLGSQILRAETASIGILSAYQFSFVFK